MKRRTATITWPTRRHTLGREGGVWRVIPAKPKPANWTATFTPKESAADGESRTGLSHPKTSRQAAESKPRNLGFQPEFLSTPTLTVARVAAHGPGGGGSLAFYYDPRVFVNTYVCSDFDSDVV